MTFEAIPLEHFGLEIRGIDPTREIPEDVRQEMYDLWLRHGILLFREMGQTSDAHLRLAQCFGPLQIHPVERVRLKEDPNLMLLATENNTIPMQYVNGEVTQAFIYWHSDMAYVPEINKGSLLRMVECPERGGNTSWTDAAMAYDDLPADMKELLGSLEMIQVNRQAAVRPWGEPGLSLRVAPADEFPIPPPTIMPEVLQPMVITHQETGIKSLLLSPLGYVGIAGMAQKEADELFEQVCRHAFQEKYRYTHKWAPGDMILWDNRRTMHLAWGYPLGMRRHAQRATLDQCQPTGRYYQPQAA